MASCSFDYLLAVVTLAIGAAVVSGELSPYYYDYVCPNALPTIKRVVEAVVMQEPRMGGALLRLHFHDCFVNGCDASILLDATPAFDSEKNALPNKNSVKGFEVIDKIKSEVDEVCGCPLVSCSDILAVAARDSVVALGGPTWQVQLGRRDSTTANISQANVDLPAPFLDFPKLIEVFNQHGLDEKDLVALSGGHTLGSAQCFTFRDHIYNDTSINPTFARVLQNNCPRGLGEGDSNLSPFDPTPNRFDSAYFTNLMYQKGLLHSDQELLHGGKTAELVHTYSTNYEAFAADFATSMVKMGNIKLLTGNNGQIRSNCRVVN